MYLKVTTQPLAGPLQPQANPGSATRILAFYGLPRGQHLIGRCLRIGAFFSCRSCRNRMVGRPADSSQGAAQGNEWPK